MTNKEVCGTFPSKIKKKYVVPILEQHYLPLHFKKPYMIRISLASLSISDMQ